MSIFRKVPKSDDDETLILTCECVGGDMELDHAVTFVLQNLRFTDGAEVPEAFLTTHLHVCQNTFWRRLKTGIGFILGKKSRYGHYMETLIAPKDAWELRDFFDRFIQAWTEFEAKNKPGAK